MTGMEAYDKGDYATALKEWRLAAAQGDADAQYGLGVMYNHARGVLQDYEEALLWYSLAAEQGQASAFPCSAQATNKKQLYAATWLRLSNLKPKVCPLEVSAPATKRPTAGRASLHLLTCHSNTASNTATTPTSGPNIEITTSAFHCVFT